MAITLEIPEEQQLDEVVSALRSWQRDDAPIQLHPGDLGWFWRFGRRALAGALRAWNRGEEIIAIGLIDGPETFRMTVAPGWWGNDELARRVSADLTRAKGILPADKVAVEIPDGTRVQQLLAGGWSDGESWTPLRRHLHAPVEQRDLQTEIVVSDEQLAQCIAVHGSAWGSSWFTSERWHVMADGTPFAEARCLLARDSDGVPVATVTVWSAGPGKPGLIEPLGVHAHQRRCGYGAAMCMAAAAHLRELGSSSALVCTPSSQHSAIATY